MAPLDVAARLASAVVLVLGITVSDQRVQAQCGGGGPASRTGTGETAGDLLAGIAGKTGAAGTPLSGAGFIGADAPPGPIGLLLHLFFAMGSHGGCSSTHDARGETPALVCRGRERLRSLAVCSTSPLLPSP